MGSWEVRHTKRSFWRRLSSSQLFVSSFLLLIILGGIGLKTLPGLYTGAELSWLDAFFTAASAVCVTGLIVVDTGTYFTFAGQLFVLLLIQLGGLGFITFTTLIIVALGRRLSLRQEAITSGAYALPQQVHQRLLVGRVVAFTLVTETIGALLLYALWVPRFGVSGAIWPAVFHAVSAFCNAGFSTFSDSLVSFQEAPLTLSVIMLLIVVGGIGYVVADDLLAVWRRSGGGGTGMRLTLHSKVALTTTALLLILGWACFAAFESRLTLAGLAPGHQVVNSLFLSVTARTAGFNTIDYGLAAVETDFLTILLMMIGGSPGSTAGGLKTTTVALIGLLAWSRLRGRQFSSIWGRTVPEETIQRAIGLFVLSFGVVTAAIFLYVAAEADGPAVTRDHAGFLRYMFEAVSAFNTVGLSMGVTPDLSAFSRVLTIVLMFVGRVGPLTFAAAIALRQPLQRDTFRYAHEDVLIG